MELFTKKKICIYKLKIFIFTTLLMDSKPKNYVSNKDESVRMFKSDILELFTKVHYTMPLFVFLPVIGYFTYFSLFVQQLNILPFLGMIPVGIAAWTLTEYVLHRFVFHYYPTSSWGKTVHFWFHGVHHDYPNDSNRLVMAPVISIPLAWLFYTGFKQVFGEIYINPFFVGLVSGYLFYDMTHYALHHTKFTSKFWIDLKNHHMYHHYKEPDNGFGVSTTFWDLVFQTTFRKNNREITDQKPIEVE